MKKPQSFILSFCIALLIGFTSCEKKEEIIPNEPLPIGEVEKPEEPTKPVDPVKPITIAYTVKASENTLDGSKLNIAPGSYVAFEAGQRGPLYIKNFVGEEGNPITFINSKNGQTIFKGSGPWAIKVGYSKHIKISGTGTKNAEYGIMVDGGHNGLVLPELTTNYEINNVEVKNCGFAGIMGKTDPNCDKSTWRDNFIMKGVSLHHNYIHDVDGEGFYIGNSFYNGKSESCGTVYPHEIHGLRVFKNIVKNVGCEGIQVGCASRDCEVYDNYIENPGKSPFANFQNNGLQIGAGTSGKCYNNIIKNAPGNGMIVNGVGGNLVYNNFILNSGQLGIFCDERTTPTGGYSFINNTIVNTGSDGIKLYSEEVPFNNIINNIIINPKTGKFLNTNNGVKVTNNNNYFSADIASVKFENAGSGNYKLGTGSPAIDKGANVSSFGITKDLLGNTRVLGSAADIGAYESK
jgi:hypothetical protein